MFGIIKIQTKIRICLENIQSKTIVYFLDNIPNLIILRILY